MTLISTHHIMATYEDWKKAWIVRSVAGVIKSGRPVSKEWGIPMFMETLPGLFEKFMGSECWSIYQKLSEEDQDKAREYITSGGTEISHMLGTPVWEDWREEPLDISLDGLPADIRERVLAKLRDELESST